MVPPLAPLLRIKILVAAVEAAESMLFFSSWLLLLTTVGAVRLDGTEPLRARVSLPSVLRGTGGVVWFWFTERW